MREYEKIWRQAENRNDTSMKWLERLENPAFSEKVITFMVDPRLVEASEPWRYDLERHKLVSRRQIPKEIRDCFVWPSEFYPEFTEEGDDPDEQQDWFNEKGLWQNNIMHRPELLERMASFKEFLYNRPEREIIVISSNRILETLVKDRDFAHMEGRTCTWKTTVSGRKKLVPKSIPENCPFFGEYWHERSICNRCPSEVSEPVPDDDYSHYWEKNRWRSDSRSDLYYKWFRKPYAGMISLLNEFERLRKLKEELFLAEETYEKLSEEKKGNMIEELKGDRKEQKMSDDEVEKSQSDDEI